MFSAQQVKSQCREDSGFLGQSSLYQATGRVLGLLGDPKECAVGVIIFSDMGRHDGDLLDTHQYITNSHIIYSSYLNRDYDFDF